MSSKQLSFVTAVVILAGANAWAQTDAQGNLPFYAWEECPGVYFYLMEQPAHSIEMRATYDCVTPPTGLLLEFPANGKEGLVFKELARKESKDVSGFAGLSVWVKGDGSTGKGMVQLGYRGGPRFEFPLADKRWHRVDVPWDKLPGADTKNVEVLAFGLTADSPRPARYVIDRPLFVKDFAALGDEKALADKANAAQPKADPPMPVPKAYATGGGTLVESKVLMENKKPIRIVACGDSVTGGAQLWPMGDQQAQDNAAYHQVLRSLLVKHYRYDRIEVVRVSKGGYQAHQAAPNFDDEVLALKPNLVILAFGAADTEYSDVNRFRPALYQMADKCIQSGIEVILWKPTPIVGKEDKGDAFAQAVHSYGYPRRMPMANMRGLFLAQGNEFLGQWLCDGVHPNQRAHELMGQVLFDMLH